MNSRPPNKNSEIRSTIDAIQSWLLGPEVQFAEGPHRGGVAGWFDEGGAPVFLYPEIAGYYLSWLAYFASISGEVEQAARRAELTLSWIDRLLSDGTGLQTRIYLRGVPPDDWRNCGAFLFDLAMLARGVAQVWNLADGNRRQRIHSRLTEQLLLFCRDSEPLQAFRPYPDAPSPPPHWSCVEGPYQAKAAAAILSANEAARMPSRLQEAARSSYMKWREHPRSNSTEDLHPMYYHLEGLAIAWADGWDPEALSLLENAAMGNLMTRTPETMTSGRSDVIAQALRIGSILWDRCNQCDPTSNPVHQLAYLLQQYLDGGGAILFCRNPSLRHRNVWSSIFAHQALLYYEAAIAGLPLGDRQLQFLV